MKFWIFTKIRSKEYIFFNIGDKRLNLSIWTWIFIWGQVFIIQKFCFFLLFLHCRIPNFDLPLLSTFYLLKKNWLDTDMCGGNVIIIAVVLFFFSWLSVKLVYWKQSYNILWQIMNISKKKKTKINSEIWKMKSEIWALMHTNISTYRLMFFFFRPW